MIEEFERPKRRAISSRFPMLVGPAMLAKRGIRSLKNSFTLPKLKKSAFLPHVIARHSSVLYRKLGDTDVALQHNKVKNLEIAIRKLNGLVIPPGKTFSFWKAVGPVRKRDGYVDGILLSNGKVVEGIGGGLCQLSNFLAWIFLHAETKIVERHHHSVDAFPDSGRVLPFGSGATIFSNYVDLQVRNVSDRPIQLQLWMTDSCLKGRLLSTGQAKFKYHVSERNHCFIKRNDKFFRYNEIFRETYLKGLKIEEEKVFTNFAPVAYTTARDSLETLGYEVIELSSDAR